MSDSNISGSVSATAAVHEALHTPRSRLVFQGLGYALLAGFTLYSLYELSFFDLPMIWRGLSKLAETVQFMLPPAAHGRTLDFVWAVLETLAMAFLGTLLASVLSVLFGFLGAKNVISQPLFHFGIRRFMDFLRGVDALIWALIWINVVGLGPFAGILAIAVSNTGEISKLFSEAIENVDRGPILGVRASGANLIQTIVYAILPQVLPVLLSNCLYYFESNTRSATILGIVGAGGVGLVLADRIRVMAWDQVSLLIIMILVTVYCIDNLSRILRSRFIGSSSRGFQIGN
ncbi:MAG: phosphonate ABC transporter, permease protein PhnE [Desulfovermiculus sp.]